MKKKDTRQHAQILRVSLLALALLALSGLSYFALGQAPQWWLDRDVIEMDDMGTPEEPSDDQPVEPDDYTAVNAGQLKHIAYQAFQEFSAELPPAALNAQITLSDGVTLGTLEDHVSSFVDTATGTPITGGDPFVAVNHGQVKTIAKPFYDVLIEAGYIYQHNGSWVYPWLAPPYRVNAGKYPWERSAGITENYALANIGQVKFLFSFHPGGDSDSDGLPDDWEILNFGNLDRNDDDDPDRDGNSNAAEFANDTNPWLFEPGVAYHLKIKQGDGQKAEPAIWLPLPLKAQLLDVNGQPVAETSVTAEVVEGDGLVSLSASGANPAATLSATTDATGMVSFYAQTPSQTGRRGAVKFHCGPDEVVAVTFYQQAAIPAYAWPAGIAGSITIDGQINETAWDLSETLGSVPIGVADGGAWFGTLWDADYLYVAIEVIDGDLFNDSTNPWDDDSVEVYIDGNHNGGPYDSVDRQFVVGHGDTTVWEKLGRTTDVLQAQSLTLTGYIVEIAIPWANLPLTPAADFLMGFDIGLNDDDNGAARENQAMWRGVGNNWSRTDYFGDLKLQGTRLPVLRSVSGDGQTAQANGHGNEPLKVRVLGADGNPLTTGNVTFTVATGGDIGGAVSGDGGFTWGTQATVAINTNGEAQVLTTLPDEAGAELFVEATCADTPGQVATFTLWALGAAEAWQINNSIVVDGRLDEVDWANGATADANVIELAREILGVTNNTAKFTLLWDETHLYIGARVEDRHSFTDSTHAWEDDSVEVYLDARAEGGTGYRDDDRQFAIRRNENSIWEQHGLNDGVVAASASSADGFVVEIALPWSNLGITPAVLRTIGLDLAHNDDDNGGNRESQIMWSGTNRNWTDPSRFGRVKLMLNPAIDDDRNGREDEPGQLAFEAESGIVIAPFEYGHDNTASANTYIQIPETIADQPTVPDPQFGEVTYQFEVAATGYYSIAARYQGEDEDQSAWIAFNSGSFVDWEFEEPASQWQWALYTPATGHALFWFNAGTQHTMKLRHHTAGLKLDAYLLTLALLDTDEDQLPDDWEITHFADLTQGAGDDPDQDNHNNLAEYLAGTDPNNYYSQPGSLQSPVITFLNGNPIYSAPGELLEIPIEITIDGNPAANSPVTLTTTEPRLTTASDGSNLSATLEGIRANGDGQILVYFQQPSTVGEVNTLIANADSIQSSLVIETTTEVTLAAPQNLVAIATDASTAVLSWESVSGAESYQLERSVGTPDNFSPFATVSTIAHADTTLSADTVYFYRATAIAGTDISAYSNIAETNTFDTDNDGEVDPSDPYPRDWYDNRSPIIKIVSGNNQYPGLNYELANTIDIRVTNAAGVALPNAPLSVDLVRGNAEARLAGSAAAYSPSFNIVTNGNGQVSLRARITSASEDVNILRVTAINLSSPNNSLSASRAYITILYGLDPHTGGNPGSGSGTNSPAGPIPNPDEIFRPTPTRFAPEPLEKFGGYNKFFETHTNVETLMSHYCYGIDQGSMGGTTTYWQSSVDYLNSTISLAAQYLSTSLDEPGSPCPYSEEIQYPAIRRITVGYAIKEKKWAFGNPKFYWFRIHESGILTPNESFLPEDWTYTPINEWVTAVGAGSPAQIGGTSQILETPSDYYEENNYIKIFSAPYFGSISMTEAKAKTVFIGEEMKTISVGGSGNIGPSLS